MGDTHAVGIPYYWHWLPLQAYPSSQVPVASNHIISLSLMRRLVDRVEYFTCHQAGAGSEEDVGDDLHLRNFRRSQKYVAGEWWRHHTSQRLLAWLERCHAWRRA